MGPPSSCLAAMALVLLIKTACASDDHCVPTVSRQCSFVDDFTDEKQIARWRYADGYANGVPFDVWWSKNNAAIDTSKGQASIKLNKNGAPNHGMKYTSGHFLSENWYGYGCFEARIKPMSQQGLVNAFFAYAGPWDKPPEGSGQHSEIDFEFIQKPGNNAPVLQSNYFSNGHGGNEHLIPLDFDPTQDFHDYAFKWTPSGIYWYVDGELRYTATQNIPQESTSTLRIMMNLWAVSRVGEGWAGKFVYDKEIKVKYAGVRYTKGQNCKVMGFDRL